MWALCLTRSPPRRVYNINHDQVITIHSPAGPSRGGVNRGTIAARAFPRRGSYANAVVSKNRSSTLRVMRETLLS